jgi:3',5'-cyclic AMP phosphodiesterase CpdA
LKIWILSDLHLEFDHVGDLIPPDADVCVAAGDIQNKGIVESLEWLDRHVAKFMPVVFVAGNHEFYRAEHSLPDEIIRGQAWEGSGRVFFLENSHVTIKDVTFLGATLWTDFDVLGKEWTDLAIRNIWTSMNDYQLIAAQKSPYIGLKPAHTYQKHIRSRHFLEGALAANYREKVVLVTHHAPSLRSVEDRYLKDLLTPAFASNLEAMMKPQAKLWVHGHVHHHVDYILKETRVVANPRGYPKEACHKDYDFGFVVEV